MRKDTTKLDAMTREMPPSQVMEAFLQHLHGQLEYPSLSPTEAVALHLIQTFRWLPAQVEALTDRELKLILHTNWLQFLDTLPENTKNCYLHVLATKAGEGEAIWRTIETQ